jgi:hypothetical protein
MNANEELYRPALTPIAPNVMAVPGVDPGISPGTRCTSVSDCLSMTYSSTGGRMMSGHDDAGKGVSVSMLMPADVTYQRSFAFICGSKFLL